MVFNFVVLLSLVNLGLSAPDPNVAVGVKVNVEDNGGNDCCEKGCIFGGEVYAHKCHLKDTCFEMQCIDGTWKYKGFNEKCGDCTFGGEPLVYTFDNLNNTKPYSTEHNLTGEFVMAQPGFVVPALFGVNGHFTDKAVNGYDCHQNGFTTCINGVTYHELGDEVTMVLIDNKLPLLVYVNGFHFPIGASVVNIPGTNMLVFKHSSSFGHGGPGGYSGSTNCISVIGSLGLTVTFCASGPQGWPWSYIYAMSDLQDNPSGLYGLCNTFTGQNQDCFWERNGTCVANWACGRGNDYIDGGTVDRLCDKVADTWKVPA